MMHVINELTSDLENVFFSSQSKFENLYSDSLSMKCGEGTDEIL